MPLIAGDATRYGYASIDELETWLGRTAPDSAGRLLERASGVIDTHLTTAVYAVDSDGTATDSIVTSALSDATCAQVEFWLAGDEEDDILGPVQGVALGGMQVQFGAGENRATPTYLAPRAWRALHSCAGISW